MLRYYKKPAKIGDELSKRTMEVLPFGILLHIIMAIFMYGAGSIFAQEVVDVILTTSDGTSYTVYRGKEDTLLERVLILYIYIYIYLLVFHHSQLSFYDHICNNSWLPGAEEIWIYNIRHMLQKLSEGN